MQLLHASASASPVLWSPPQVPSLDARETTMRLLSNPVHIAMMVVAMSALASTAQWLLLAALAAADIIGMRLLAGSKAIRHVLARCEHMDAQRERARERQMLRASMSEPHRNELERLEAMVDSIYQRLPDAPGSRALLEQLGLDRLMATYASLAVSHREGTVMLEMVPLPRTDSDSRARDRRADGDTRARARLARISRTIDEIADIIVTVHESNVAPDELIDEARHRVDEALYAVDAIADVSDNDTRIESRRG